MHWYPGVNTRPEKLSRLLKDMERNTKVVLSSNSIRNVEL